MGDRGRKGEFVPGSGGLHRDLGFGPTESELRQLFHTRPLNPKLLSSRGETLNPKP